MGSNVPICSRPIISSKSSKEEDNKEIQELLDQGLLIRSKLPWSLPILILKKKDGTNRVVMDYRRLNFIPKKDVYLLPRIDD